TVKPVSVYRQNVTSIASGHWLALPLRQTGPGRADRQPRHRSHVEAAANDWFQLRETTALAQYPGVFHRAEQRVVETLHRIAAARGRGMKRIGKHPEPPPAGKRHGFPQSHR